ncbi:MAG: phage holin [Oscillospiraceae bacterium]|nr:phage holin [Oscillospiraceae bacterium]
MNWKVRFKNKTWLTAFVALIISFVYQVLAMFDIAPVITQDSVIQAANLVLMMLSAMGVLIDPTTMGITDSRRAMSYTEPNGEK